MGRTAGQLFKLRGTFGRIRSRINDSDLPMTDTLPYATLAQLGNGAR